MAALLLLARPAWGQRSAVTGQVLDAATRRPVPEVVVMLVGTSRSALTDGQGSFRLGPVDAGAYALRVSHVAYGDRTVRVAVAADSVTRVRLILSQVALALEPLEVEVVSPAASRSLAVGTIQGAVTRAQIEEARGRNLHLGEVLRLHVAGVRVRRVDQLVGTPICIELRAVRTSTVRSCSSPLVYLDGVPITNPTQFYGSIALEQIERIEVVSAAEAGVRFGPGALNGALLIESRRPGAARVRHRARLRVPGSFDWNAEVGPHRTRRVFLSSLAGSAAGLALGLVAADRCLGMRWPSGDSVVAKCDAVPAVGAGLAAVGLPALGGAIGASLAGATERSRGRLAPALVGAAMALLPGYALVITSQRDGSRTLRSVGSGLIVLGVPVATTVADRLFRGLRSGS